jgi:hypothetical protein
MPGDQSRSAAALLHYIPRTAGRWPGDTCQLATQARTAVRPLQAFASGYLSPPASSPKNPTRSQMGYAT